MGRSMLSRRALAGLAVLSLLAADAQAGGARILRPSGGAEFSQISTAVYAALPGDVIVVGEGDYDGFTLEGKAVSIVGAPGASVRIVHPVVVRDIPAGQVVLFDNLTFAPDITNPDWDLQSSDVPALWVSDCDASVRIQDCKLDTSFQHPYCAGVISPDPTRRESPLRLERCPDVAVVGSELVTGAAGSGWGYCYVEPGAPGVQVTDGKLALYGCSITGGFGGWTLVLQLFEAGGPGVDARDSFVFVAGSTLTGGGTKAGPAFGGSAVSLDPASTLVLVDTVLQPLGSVPAIVGGGSVLALPDAARGLAAPGVVAGGSTIQLEAAGVPGDLLWTASAQAAGFRFATQLAGVWLAKSPAKIPFAPSGSIGASGALAFAVPAVEPEGLARLVHLQGITKSAGDGTVVTNPRVVLVLSSQLGPDCNGNGVSDYVDVLLGGAPDADDDLVPDGCPVPQPKTVHVDVAAAPGGDGSPQAPFSNMAQASGAALDGDTILIADGTYVGLANRAFDFDGRRLTVASVNGPDACVFDFENQARGFLAKVPHASSGASRIEGLTLLRPLPGPAPVSAPTASVVVSGVELEIVGCRFGVGYSPILTLPGSAPLTVRETEFIDCDKGLELWAPATFEDCRFEGVQGICILKQGSAQPLRLSRTSFVGTGGGLRALTSPSGQLTVENCLFQGNWALAGRGGIELDGGNALIDACTFVGNHSQYEFNTPAPTLGGALYLHAPTTGPVLLSNSILRDNTCGLQGFGGEQIAIEGGITYKLTVVNSNVQDGKPGIAGPSGATIWGAGNQTADPQFVDSDGPDGDPQTLDDNDLHLGTTSPCIDAGDNTLALGLVDLEGLPRFVDDPNVPDTGSGSPPLCDMGCYEKP